MSAALTAQVVSDLDNPFEREIKRLIIHLFDRGIKFGPVDENAGLRTLSLLMRWKAATPVQERTWGMAPGSAKLISLTSDHRYGRALDGRATVFDAKKLGDAMRGYEDIYEYVEHVIKAYGLNIDRPNYPRIPSERNHFALTTTKGIKPLTPAALARYRAAIK